MQLPPPQKNPTPLLPPHEYFSKTAPACTLKSCSKEAVFLLNMVSQSLPAPHPPICHTWWITMTCLPLSPATMPTNQLHQQLITLSVQDFDWLSANLCSVSYQTVQHCFPAYPWSTMHVLDYVPWLASGKPACLPPLKTGQSVPPLRCQPNLNWIVSHCLRPSKPACLLFLTTRLCPLPAGCRFRSFLATMRTHARSTGHLELCLPAVCNYL